MATQPRARGGAQAGRENRAALLAAARDVFAEHGINAPLRLIAQRAGVGQGSLYRHFPDRIALAAEVFEDNVVDIEELSAQPESTLRDLVELATRQAIDAATLVELIAAHGSDSRIAQFGDRLRAALLPKIDAAHTNGELGKSRTVDDVMLAISMVSLTVSHAPDGQRGAIAARTWDLLTPALRS
ncbi:TetR/AcrR family transcriptional regulator [Demequina sp. B12]|uniref:TetR/AcrR family transcriptional regulator n=1 Tax=Demequina sp. B12 TaxID=2992757 RepID=UPI00237B9224|nr:TetR/AcrR family transcriptional regulator [Demequina sp. B12]